MCDKQKTLGDIVGMPETVPVDNFGVCYSCGDEFKARELVKSDIDREKYCTDCYSETYSRCDSCGDEVESSDIRCEEYRTDSYSSRRTATTDCLCESCFDSAYTKCDSCSNLFRAGDVASVNGDSYCDCCLSDNFSSCENCGEYVASDYVHYVNDCCYCSSCAPSERNEFDAKRMTGETTYNRTVSRRKFGVEIETDECPDHSELDGSYFGACEDGSIDGMEFVSSVLYGDAGIKAIEDFAASANKLGFSVDSKCGYHAHFDANDLGITELKSVAAGYFYTEKLWQSFVSRERRKNRYCDKIEWSIETIADIDGADEFRDWSNDLDRYCWFNVNAYAKHGTIEIRLHSATLDSEKITSWVIAHARFMDYCASRTMAQLRREFAGKSVQSQFNRLAEILGDAKLVAYLTSRAAKFGEALGNPATFATA